MINIVSCIHCTSIKLGSCIRTWDVLNMKFHVLCFVDRASLYNLVNEANLVHNFFLSMFINLYMFRANMCPSSGETTVFMRNLVLVILCG